MKKKLEVKVLAEGEVTGHMHEVEADVYEDDETGVRTFEGPTPVIHPEHETIPLGPRKWASGVVQEFDWLEGVMRDIVE